MSGKNPGDVTIIIDWLRKLKKAHEILEFRMPLSDYTYVQACGGNPERIQVYNCVEHIAEILGLDVEYKHVYSDLLHENGLYSTIEFEGVKYFDYQVEKGDNNGDKNISD